MERHRTVVGASMERLWSVIGPTSAQPRHNVGPTSGQPFVKGRDYGVVLPMFRGLECYLEYKKTLY